MQDAVRPDPQITRLARTTSRTPFPQRQPRVHAMDEALLGLQLRRPGIRRRRTKTRRADRHPRHDSPARARVPNWRTRCQYWPFRRQDAHWRPPICWVPDRSSGPRAVRLFLALHWVRCRGESGRFLRITPGTKISTAMTPPSAGTRRPYFAWFSKL